MRNFTGVVMMVAVAACGGGESGAPTCQPNEFLGCDGTTALRCNAVGTEEIREACGGTCDATAGRCNVCVPASTRCSVDGGLQTCSADGQGWTTEACAAGCATAGPAARCKHLVPVWIPDACDAPAAMAARTLAGTLDTSDASACDRVVPQQTAQGVVLGPEICVVSARALEVSQLRVVGQRALALVGDNIRITNRLDIGGETNRNGPGGGFVANGQFDTFYGGGGAGFKQPGAAGGGNEFGQHARQGGTLRDPLGEGGFSGGTVAGDDSGFTSTDDAFVGGGGGGALIVACRGAVSITGAIAANGGAGGIGNNGNGGGGGGSGGYVVVQGARVVVSGPVNIDGGHGGAACSGASCRPGSPGGTGAQPPQPAPNHDSETTGGGGGSIGALQVYTPAGITPALSAQPFTYEPPRTVDVR